jgi:hypothetical protein
VVSTSSTLSANYTNNDSCHSAIVGVVGSSNDNDTTSTSVGIDSTASVQGHSSFGWSLHSLSNPSNEKRADGIISMTTNNNNMSGTIPQSSSADIDNDVEVRIDDQEREGLLAKPNVGKSLLVTSLPNAVAIAAAALSNTNNNTTDSIISNGILSSINKGRPTTLTEAIASIVPLSHAVYPRRYWMLFMLSIVAAQQTSLWMSYR